MIHRQDLFSKIQDSYRDKRPAIQSRLSEFKEIKNKASNLELFEELTFCILAAGTSAKMALNSVAAVRDILYYGDFNQIKKSLAGHHRYPNLRSYHTVYTREYLKKEHDFLIRDFLDSFTDNFQLRRYLASNKDIMGIGFKEASHFLRNTGCTGFSILDKHIVNTLYNLGVLANNVIPVSESAYLAAEMKMKNLSDKININIDELDLLLWSEKTGEILK